MHGMRTALETPRATAVAVTASELTVALEDGRRVSVLITWFPRLSYATPEEREHVEITARGKALRWPLLDEDIRVEHLLIARKEGESATSLKRWRAEMDRRRAEDDRGPWGEEKPLPTWWPDDSEDNSHA